MSRYLTEREAWLWLAEDAARGVKLPSTGDRDAAGVRSFNGLCGAIRHLMDANKIGRLMAKRLDATIDRERATRRKDHCGEMPAYLWPLSVAGFRRRVTFCNKQAARFTR